MVVGEAFRNAGHALVAGHEAVLDLVLELLKFALRDELALHALHLVVHRRFHFARVHAHVAHGEAQRQPRIFQPKAERPAKQRELVVLHHALVQSRTFAAAQNLVEHVDGVVIGGALRRDGVRLHHEREAILAVDGVADLRCACGFNDGGTGDVAAAAWDVLEVLLDEGARLRHVEVAGNAERGVLWHVKRLVEIHEVAVVGGIEVLHGPDGRPLVGVLVVGHRHRGGEELAIGLVVVALALLFFDDLVLGVDADLLNLGVEHALGFQPKPQLELVARQELVVEGAVLGRVGVQDAAGVFHVGIELATRDVLRALKQEVLEEVGHARAVGPLVLGADVVKHGDCDERGGVVLVEDDVEAVVQIEFGELDLASLGLAPRSGRGQGRGCAEEQEGGESHVGKLSLQDSDLGVSCLHGNEPSRRSGSARPRAGAPRGLVGG